MLKYQKHTAVLLLLVICFSLFVPFTAVADDDMEVNIKDKGNPFQRAVAGLLNFFPKTIAGIWDAAGFKSMSELVFASGLSEAEKDALPWQPGQLKFVYKFYMGLIIFVIPIYTLLIGVSAFKFINASVNPAERAEAKDSIMRLFYGILIIFLAPYLIEVLLKTSLLLTQAIASAFTSIGNVQDLNALNPDILSSNSISTGSVLGTVIVKIMFAMLFLYFNVLYIIRMVAISVMFVFTPLMTIFWVVNKNTTAVAVWLGELASNAFMPVAHALVLCVILMLADVKNVSDGSAITILIMMYTLIPLSEALRNSMQSIFTRAAGFAEDSTAKKVMMGVLGVGAIAGVAKLGSTTMGGGISGGVKNIKAGGNIPKGTPPNKGSKMPTPTRKPVTNTPLSACTPSGSGANNINSGSAMQVKTTSIGVNTSSINDNKIPATTSSVTIPTATSTKTSTPISSATMPITTVSKISNPVSGETKILPNTKAKAITYNTAPRMATKTPTINKAAMAGNIAGTAAKLAALPALAVAGAVPGGQALATGGAKVAHGVATKGVPAITAGGQIASAYAKTRNLEQSLQQVTGTTDKKQAMSRIINPQKATNYQVPKNFTNPSRVAPNMENSKDNNKYQVKDIKSSKPFKSIKSPLPTKTKNHPQEQRPKINYQRLSYNNLP